MVHVESNTGDGVLLNMLKGSHFGASNVTIPKGKIYGPWLIYINNGDISDAKSRASLFQMCVQDYIHFMLMVLVEILQTSLRETTLISMDTI